MENKQMQADEVDKAILRELRVNCRRSYRELAKATSLSPAALIDRVRKLEKSGAIKGYVASLDFVKLGYEFMAMVRMSIDPQNLLVTQEKISFYPGVYAVYDVTGEYDSIAIVIARNRTELSSLIKKILGTKHVKRTNTDMVLNVVKDPFYFNEI